MFDYRKTKKADTPKRGMTHRVVQQRAIPDRNSYAGRFAKPGYYPVREMGSVVQRTAWCARCNETLINCQCGEYHEPANEDNDPDYYEPSCHQYLDPTKLRANLGATRKSGEAHHIIPGNIVARTWWGNDGNKDHFNEAWNGIMLDGTQDDEGNVIHKYTGLEGAPKILHRDKNKRCHRNYDNNVRRLIRKRSPKDLIDFIDLAGKIKSKIMHAESVYALDHLSL